jgi:glycosyltransferase involved in cell wall biosynthesis
MNRDTIPIDNIVVASAGRLEPQKAYSDLIKAAKIICAKNPNVTFVIAGEGSLRKELTKEIEDYGLRGRFLLPGFVPDIWKFLCGVDIFAMSSLFEGLCYAVLEAGIMGIPTVATGIGGLAYSILDGKTGFLIEPLNPGKLAEKLFFLIENRGAAMKMGHNAKERVLRLFTMEQMISSLDRIYKGTLMKNQTNM